MIHSNGRYTSFLYTSILYLGGLTLFLEWFYPLEQITDTKDISFFVIYAVFCFLISLFELKWWASFMLKGLGLLFILHGLYFNVPIISAMWIEQFTLDLSTNVQALASQEWYYLTPSFRSFLFLLLIWLMSYLLHYWFVQMKRVFLFVFLTFFYLTILDTFTPYDAGGSVVRTFIVSLIILGIANFMKELDQEAIHFTWIKKTPFWLLPLILSVIFAAIVGYASPKYDPQWPDPVPFIKSAAESAGTSGIGLGSKKVGYGEDDTRLGGSFEQDYTPVFQTKAKEGHYWRIETKDFYTGKGWVNSSDPAYLKQADGDIQLDMFDSTVKTEPREITVKFHENVQLQKAVYPYGVDYIGSNRETNDEYWLDRHSGAIETRIDDQAASLSGYTITYNYPTFVVDELKSSAGNDPLAIREQYTQLPSELPERVFSLAGEITADYDNRYDKTKAIETYFSNNGYKYQISNVPIPGEDEDYVDQFLFDSKVGYCDNFSTSMVVLLRTLDIPARWVKGFASGDIIDSTPTHNVYEVTNSDAHSWVEVYFPGSGWVPFEPTKGFTNPTDFQRGQGEFMEENLNDEQLDNDESDTPEEENREEEEQATSVFNPSNGSIGSIPFFNWKYAFAFVLILVIVAVVVYKMRYRLQTKAITVKLNNHQDARTFQDAYHFLMKLLKNCGYEKAKDETLREFAHHIDTQYGTDEMGRLTNYYEKMLYKNDANEANIEELTQLWKNLINRIKS